MKAALQLEPTQFTTLIHLKKAECIRARIHYNAFHDTCQAQVVVKLIGKNSLVEVDQLITRMRPSFVGKTTGLSCRIIAHGTEGLSLHPLGSTPTAVCAASPSRLPPSRAAPSPTGDCNFQPAVSVGPEHLQ